MSTSNTITKNDLKAVLEELPLIQQATDFIVEQGTSGIWTYRKWNSGIAECWGWQTKTASGAGVNFTLSFPSNFFTAAPTATCSAGASGEADAGINYVNATASYIDTWVHRNSTGSNSVWVYAHALGRWK
jgi:hypothetical protein